ncbi:MAG: DUF3662 and FHA domain-containing protein [Dehalococcoidia bacterium]|nr:DUF3662 and FHA domain-containing protein [Dehalococcoidia bacterium]
MGALFRFERFVEQFVEGGFTRLLRSQLQPVEIAKRLARAMEDSQVISAGGRVIVANRYEILLSPQDFVLFEPYKATLERELAEYAVAVVKERRLFLANRAVVVLSSSSSAMPKRPLIRASKADVGAPGISANPQEDRAALDEDLLAPPQPDGAQGMDRTTVLKLDVTPRVTGTRGCLQLRGGPDLAGIPINRSPFTIGRGLDNDLVLEDKRISRHHARIEDINARLLLVDLQSTNGTTVNGDGVSKCLLANGDVVSLGGLELVVALERRD